MNAKKYPKYLGVSTITSFLSLFGIAEGAIWWQPTPQTPYTASTPITLTVDPTATDAAGREAAGFAGIEAVISSSLDGAKFFATGGAGGGVVFETSAPLVSGDMVSFSFDFNFQLFSGARQLGAGSQVRSAALFRVATENVLGTLETTLGGGNDTIQNYFGTAPAQGAGTHSNAGILNLNEGGNADRSAFDSFSGPDTVITTEGSTPGAGHFVTTFTDNGRSAPDYAFQSWEFKFTNDSTDPIPAGTQIRFTFEGQNFDEQVAAIPEPSSALLFSLSVFALMFRRRKK